MNRKSVKDLLSGIKICVPKWISMTNRNLSSVWMRQGFRLIILPLKLKIIATKGARDTVKFTGVGRWLLMHPVMQAESSSYPSYRETHQNAKVNTTHSGYINEDIFMERLQHFRKNLLILDGHASYSSLSFWNATEKMTMKFYASLVTQRSCQCCHYSRRTISVVSVFL
jgi:hypothetical protein